jgi:hypothetical protein
MGRGVPASSMVTVAPVRLMLSLWMVQPVSSTEANEA